MCYQARLQTFDNASTPHPPPLLCMRPPIPPNVKTFVSSVGLVPGESPPDRSRRHTLKRMCEVLWGPVLSSLSHVMMHCSDPIVVSTAVDGYKAFAVAAGILGKMKEEAFLTGCFRTLCILWASLVRWKNEVSYVDGLLPFHCVVWSCGHPGLDGRRRCLI